MNPVQAITIDRIGAQFAPLHQGRVKLLEDWTSEVTAKNITDQHLEPDSRVLVNQLSDGSYVIIDMIGNPPQ